tara:strand:- start:11523 stop:12020 length:498 start_codon:yes stop_codon:yes gene_type:complete
VKFDFDLNFFLVMALVIFAVISRLIPHPPNFTPVGGIAIFAATKFYNKNFAILIPLIILFLSDIFLGLSLINLFVYLSFILISKFVITSKIQIIKKIFIASIIFFFVTNFGVWLIGYPKTLEGFINCFILAIPFYFYTLLGDLFYTYFLIYTHKFIANNLVFDSK